MHAARAEDKTDELKKLNRSIFRPAITFNKDSKRAAQDAKVAARYEEERTNRERGMADVRESQNRLGRVAAYGRPTEDDDDDEGIGARRRGPAQQAARKQANARYQFEATESDDEMENELDDNLDEIAKATGALRAIAIAAGEEVDRQNDRIDEIAQKTGKLNTRVDITTNRVRSIFVLAQILLTKLFPHFSSSASTSRWIFFDLIASDYYRRTCITSLQL